MDHDALPASRAASRPLFWLALALLALNDHVLKGAGALPAELTGKLSDFAGLVVAPVVLAALVRARTPRARGLCLVAVGVGFSAINLVPSLASAVQAAVPWVITVDPSDLVALPSLGLSWWLLAARRERSATALSKIGIGFGLVACMATSYSNEGELCAADAECERGWICCDGLCVDPEWHDEHCGGCGIECGVTRLCESASCAPIEAAGVDDPALDLRMSLPDGVAVPSTAPAYDAPDPRSPRNAEMPLAR